MLDFSHSNEYVVIRYVRCIPREFMGPQAIFIFYLACALGAFALHNAIGFYQIHELRNQLSSSSIPMNEIDSIIKNTDRSNLISVLEEFLRKTIMQLMQILLPIFNYVLLQWLELLVQSLAYYRHSLFCFQILNLDYTLRFQ